MRNSPVANCPAKTNNELSVLVPQGRASGKDRHRYLSSDRRVRMDMGLIAREKLQEGFQAERQPRWTAREITLQQGSI